MEYSTDLLIKLNYFNLTFVNPRFFFFSSKVFLFLFYACCQAFIKPYNPQGSVLIRPRFCARLRPWFSPRF